MEQDLLFANRKGQIYNLDLTGCDNKNTFVKALSGSGMSFCTEGMVKDIIEASTKDESSQTS